MFLHKSPYCLVLYLGVCVVHMYSVPMYQHKSPYSLVVSHNWHPALWPLHYWERWQEEQKNYNAENCSNLFLLWLNQKCERIISFYRFSLKLKVTKMCLKKDLAKLSRCKMCLKKDLQNWADAWPRVLSLLQKCERVRWGWVLLWIQQHCVWCFHLSSGDDDDWW